MRPQQELTLGEVIVIQTNVDLGGGVAVLAIVDLGGGRGLPLLQESSLRGGPRWGSG